MEFTDTSLKYICWGNPRELWLVAGQASRAGWVLKLHFSMFYDDSY